MSFVVCTNNAVSNSLIVITHDLAQNMFWNQEFYKQRPAKQPLRCDSGGKVYEYRKGAKGIRTSWALV